jgi:hypothetical protein
MSEAATILKTVLMVFAGLVAVMVVALPLMASVAAIRAAVRRLRGRDERR